MSLLTPEGLTYGHFECRSLDETLPVFTDLPASEVVLGDGGAAVVRHPNTAWRLVIHEGGADAPTKPRGNHYGYRVATHDEIEAAGDVPAGAGGGVRAHGHRRAARQPLRLLDLLRRARRQHDRDRILQPAGRPARAAHRLGALGCAAAGRELPGRGHLPQALSHGTTECDDREASNRFHTEVLGLDVVGGENVATYVAHPATPWYIVVLPARDRTHLRSVNRYTLALRASADVRTAYERLGALGPRVAALGALHEEAGDAWFLIADLDRNWWEITSSAEPNLSPAG